MEAHLWIEHLHALAWSFSRDHTLAGQSGRWPLSGNHFLRLELDDGLAFRLQAIERLVVYELLGEQSRGVGRNRVARRPERIEIGIGIARRLQRRILPARLRVLAEVEHVVVMRVPAHTHRDELDERWAASRARAFDGPREGGGDLVRVSAIDRDARNAVSGCLVGKDTRSRLLADGCRERRLIVLDDEHRRELAHGAQIDRLVPLAERRPALTHECHDDAAAAIAREGECHAGEGEGANRERRCRRQDAARHVAHVQVLAVHRGTGLAHLR